jgi:rhamnosyl/mannosyltransferase
MHQVPAQSSRLRILHIYRTYFPETQGGGQEAIRQLCLATQPLGVDNMIFALARQPEPHVMERPEGKLIRARSWLEVASCDIGAWAAFSRCRDAAAQCDIIQIHFPWPFADLLLPFIRRRNQPVVVTYHSDIVRQNGMGLGQMYAPLRRRLLGAATRVVATSTLRCASAGKKSWALISFYLWECCATTRDLSFWWPPPARSQPQL